MIERSQTEYTDFKNQKENAENETVILKKSDAIEILKTLEGLKRRLQPLVK